MTGISNSLATKSHSSSLTTALRELVHPYIFHIYTCVKFTKYPLASSYMVLIRCIRKQQVERKQIRHFQRRSLWYSYYIYYLKTVNCQNNGSSTPTKKKKEIIFWKRQLKSCVCVFFFFCLFVFFLVRWDVCGSPSNLLISGIRLCLDTTHNSNTVSKSQ